jgi:hypothetical protein
MTLAVAFFVFVLSFPVLSQENSTASPNAAQSGAEKTAGGGSQSGQGNPDQSKSSTTTPSPAAAPQTKPAPSTRLRHKRIKVSPNCDSVSAVSPAPAQNGTQTAPSAPPSDAKADSKPADGSSKPSDCPPSKKIVRQGSTSEPTIQIVGGATGAQASDARRNASDMLQSTEENLKKIETTQMTSNQQDMVKQVRQFVDQSKAATTAGDVDRARTLAWKAQLLSEELLKPEK